MPTPRPTPSAIKALKGEKTPKEEPKVEAGAPTPPQWLSAAEREHWDMFVGMLTSMRVLTPVDGFALATLCSVWQQWITLQEFVKQNGLTYDVTLQHGETVTRTRPETREANTLLNQVKSLLQEFGLTPAARAKVKVAPSSAGNKFAEFLGREKKQA